VKNIIFEERSAECLINETISKYVIKNELKIYILLPESPKKLKEKLCEGPEKSKYTINIWRGISGYSQCVEEFQVTLNV